MNRLVCVLAVAEFRVGDPAPDGYLERHEWARVQLRTLTQKRCPSCGRWRFPQEKCCEQVRRANG